MNQMCDAGGPQEGQRLAPCPAPVSTAQPSPRKEEGLPAAPMLCVYHLHQPKKEAVNTKPGNSGGNLKFQKRGRWGVCTRSELQKTEQNETGCPMRGGWA